MEEIHAVGSKVKFYAFKKTIIGTITKKVLLSHIEIETEAGESFWFFPDKELGLFNGLIIWWDPKAEKRGFIKDLEKGKIERI